MRNRSFVIADVFTEQRFGGNQLAVFIDGEGLDTSTMQNIAREMNYSETTFLLPPEEGGDYRVRIFTPAEELPFAGHPCVGTGHVIVADRMKAWTGGETTVVLETGVGPIRVTVNTESDRAGHTTMTQPLPQIKGTFSDRARLAQALSLDTGDLAELPAEAIYNGITVLIASAASLDAVQRIRVDANKLEAISREMGAATVLVFTRETVEPTSAAHCRVFAPAAGVLEDAATGSANGPLGFYMVRHGMVEPSATTKIISEQGFEMKRPSLLHIEVDTDTSTKEVTAIRVGGGVVITGRGEILLS
ncbi:MAG TPA: PhzF family phenazine biosynthesis protein [Blastocatellia bacterium]|nr:PhzF family phenazine biosynthesis protein [Blastocatellia bacterium]